MTSLGQSCFWPKPEQEGGLPHPALLDAWAAAEIMGDGTVIGLLVASEGPAYRNLGAALAIAPDGRYAGAITSGCVEAELIIQAEKICAQGQAVTLRYGAGSPVFDLRLPCGGAIEVMLFTLRDREVLRELARLRAARIPVSLSVSPQGRLSLAPYGPTGLAGSIFNLGFRPPVRYVILGAGAEALVFTGLVAGLGHEHMLLSHDEMTLNSGQGRQFKAQKLARVKDLASVPVDADTAVTLFYHDHDHEPEVLRQLLATEAFYIGAQGSVRAQQTRLARLKKMELPAEQISRLRGPIGLIPSTRDPETLAVSVLAEIMDHARNRFAANLPAATALAS